MRTQDFQRIAGALLLIACGAPTFAQKNNDSYLRQQQQQQQQDSMRRQQQQQDQQRQQMRQQMQDQQRQQMRQQMQDQQRQQMRQQMQDQQRQQQRDQMQSQQRQQQQQQMQNQQRQQQQNQLRNQNQNDARQREAQRLKDRVVYSNGIAKMNRPPTLGEMKRGFTGKVTADGRALVRVRGRVYTVPASRIGVRVPPRPKVPANDNPANDNRKAALDSQARQLAMAKVEKKKGTGARILGFQGGANPALDAKPVSFSRLRPSQEGPSQRTGPTPLANDRLQRSAILVGGRTLLPQEELHSREMHAAWIRQQEMEMAKTGKAGKVYPPHDGFVAKNLKVLDKGSYLMRVGDELGSYTSPVGESVDKMALPEAVRKQPVSYYKVVGQLPVLAGQAADHNGLSGGATQFSHGASLEDLANRGLIVKVDEAEARGKPVREVTPANQNRR